MYCSYWVNIDWNICTKESAFHFDFLKINKKILIFFIKFLCVYVCVLFGPKYYCVNVKLTGFSWFCLHDLHKINFHCYITISLWIYVIFIWKISITSSRISAHLFKYIQVEYIFKPNLKYLLKLDNLIGHF